MTKHDTTIMMIQIRMQKKRIGTFFYADAIWPNTSTISPLERTCQLASVFFSGEPTVTENVSWIELVASVRNMSSSVLSSPAQMTKSASGCCARIRLTISPLLIEAGRTSMFFLPRRISTGSFDTIAFSKWFWHSLAWKAL